MQTNPKPHSQQKELGKFTMNKIAIGAAATIACAAPHTLLSAIGTAHTFALAFEVAVLLCLVD
jgi:hypothetical protein